MGDGSAAAEWHEFQDGWMPVSGQVIEEAPLTIYVNGHELVTILCTPRQQDLLALGFLKNEALIDTLAEIDHIHVSQQACCADVWLRHSLARPERKLITSGCGGGVTFADPSIEVSPLQDGPFIEPERLFALFPRLHFPDSLHARARGVHAAALSDGERMLALVEDVGRHNTIDKLAGMCLQQAIETRGRILLTTGRISSEMMIKAARMGCPIVASRNSPTSLSVTMAQAWNITLVGYVRGHSMRVYAHPQRLRYPAEAPQPAVG